MKKQLIILFTLLVSFSFSEINYNTILDNSLVPHPDYDWQMFFRSVRVDDEKPVEEQMRNAKYWCTYKESNFSTDYMTWIVPTYKDEEGSIDQSSIVFVEAFDKDGNYIENGNELIVTEENFDEFRNVFSSSKSMRFDNGFEVKYFKIKTADNQDKITYYDGPDGNFLADSSRFQPLTYYAFGAINRGSDQYVLLGVDNRLKKASTSREKILGWVKVVEDNNKQLAVLWNSNIGLRPIEDSKLSRKSVVFPKDQDETGYNAVYKYLNSGTVNEEMVIVNENGVDKYHDKYSKKKGMVTRWLPMYDAIEEDEDFVMSVGVTSDLTDLHEDMKKLLTMEELQIVLILDGSGSMGLVWQNLPAIVEEMISTIINNDFVNAAGKSVQPKVKIFFWRGCPEKKGYISSKWITNSEDLAIEQRKIDTFQTDPTCTIRVPAAETIEYALKHDNIEANPAYVIVLGDASDRDTRGMNLLEVPRMQQFQDTTSSFLSVAGIRVNSLQELSQNNNDYATAYREFPNMFDFLLHDEKYKFWNTSSAVPRSVVQGMGRKMGNEIVEDMLQVIEELTSFSKGGKIDISKLQNQQTPFAASYLEKILKNFGGANQGAGTYFQEGLILARDEYLNTLLDTDVYIFENQLDDLWNACDEFALEMSLDDAKRLVRKTLAIFFDVDLGDVDDTFLEEKTLSEFWNAVLGDPGISQFLKPGFFENDYTFKELIDALEDSDIEDTLADNAIRIMGVLRQQTDDQFSKFSFISDFEEKQKTTYYWVKAESLNLFRDIKF